MLARFLGKTTQCGLPRIELLVGGISVIRNATSCLATSSGYPGRIARTTAPGGQYTQRPLSSVSQHSPIVRSLFCRYILPTAQSPESSLFAVIDPGPAKE